MDGEGNGTAVGGRGRGKGEKTETERGSSYELSRQRGESWSHHGGTRKVTEDTTHHYVIRQCLGTNDRDRVTLQRVSSAYII